MARLTLQLGTPFYAIGIAESYRLNELLKQCKNLKILDLKFIGLSANLTTHFQNAHFLHLKRLSLSSVSAELSAVSAFVARHPSLTALHLNMAPLFYLDDVQPGSLQNLKSFGPAGTYSLEFIAQVGVLNIEEIVLTAHILHDPGQLLFMWAPRIKSLQLSLKRVRFCDSAISREDIRRAQEVFNDLMIIDDPQDPWFAKAPLDTNKN